MKVIDNFFSLVYYLQVLATDISRQQEFLGQFRWHLDHGDCDPAQQNFRHFVLQIAIKCADISNPCRSWPVSSRKCFLPYKGDFCFLFNFYQWLLVAQVSRVWSYRAVEEFFRQGDGERELGLPLTPICDRFNVTVAKVQVGFYSFVVEPLFKEWHRFLASPLSQRLLVNLYRNQAAWEGEVLQEELQVAAVAAPPPAPPPRSAPPPPRRRLSLPATDPLCRLFDAMTQVPSDCWIIK